MLTKPQTHSKAKKIVFADACGMFRPRTIVSACYYVSVTIVCHCILVVLLLFLTVVELVIGDSSPSNIFDTNLVVNGDASNGVNGWNNVGNKSATICGYTGATTFCGGQNVVSVFPMSGYNSILRQIVYFTSAPLTTWKLIDNGNRVFMDISGRLGGMGSYSDWATLTVFQENTAGQVLNQTAIGPVTVTDRGSVTKVMYREAKHIAVAQGTRQLRIEFYSYMASTGYDIDGFGVDFTVVLRVRAPLTKTIVTLSKTRATHSMKPTVSASPTAPQGSKSVSSSDPMSQLSSHSGTALSSISLSASPGTSASQSVTLSFTNTSSQSSTPLSSKTCTGSMSSTASLSTSTTIFRTATSTLSPSLVLSLSVNDTATNSRAATTSAAASDSTSLSMSASHSSTAPPTPTRSTDMTQSLPLSTTVTSSRTVTSPTLTPSFCLTPLLPISLWVSGNAFAVSNITKLRLAARIPFDSLRGGDAIEVTAQLPGGDGGLQWLPLPALVTTAAGTAYDGVNSTVAVSQGNAPVFRIVPHARWPIDDTPFRDQRFLVTLGFRCSVTTVPLHIDVSVVPHPPSYGNGAVTLSQPMSLIAVSALSGQGSLAMSRMSSTATLMYCDGSDGQYPPGQLFGLQVGTTAWSGALGSIAEDVAVIAGGSLLMSCVVVVGMFCAGLGVTQGLDAFRAFRFPWVLGPLFGASLPTATASAAMVVGLHPDVAVRAVVAVSYVAVWGGYYGWMAVVLWRASKQYYCEKSQPAVHSSAPICCRRFVTEWMMARWHWLIKRRRTWTPRDPAAEHLVPLVVEENRVLWYPVFDVCNSVACGVASVTPFLFSTSGMLPCQVALVALCVVTAFGLAVCIVLKPCNSWINHWYTLLAFAATLVGYIAQTALSFLPQVSAFGVASNVAVGMLGALSAVKYGPDGLLFLVELRNSSLRLKEMAVPPMITGALPPAVSHDEVIPTVQSLNVEDCIIAEENEEGAIRLQECEALQAVDTNPEAVADWSDESDIEVERTLQQHEKLDIMRELLNVTAIGGRTSGRSIVASGMLAFSTDEDVADDDVNSGMEMWSLKNQWHPRY